MTYENKNIVLTGGSSGMGKATAKRLAAAGAHLFILARDARRLSQAVDEIRASAAHPNAQVIQPLSTDVTHWEAVRAAVLSVVQDGHTPDYLFNFAGFCIPGYFQELPLSAFREMMDVAYFGTLHTIKAVAPFMMQRRSGHIVNTSSVAGITGVFGYSAYAPAKYAVRGLSEVLRNELKPYGIKVTILFPPDTDTPGFQKENETKPAETFAISAGAKAMTPDQVAAALLRGVARGQFAVIPGFEGKLVYAFSGLLSFILRAKLDADVRNVQKRCGLRPCDDPLRCVTSDSY